MTNSFDASSQSLRRVQNDWQKLGIDELVHNIKTDFGLIEEIAEATKLNFNGLTILTANLEIAVVLIHKYNAVPSDITIFADYCPTTQKIAAKLGINYIDAWNYNMKFDVVFANPPFSDVTKATGKGRGTDLYPTFYANAIKQANVVAMIMPTSDQHKMKAHNDLLKQTANVIVHIPTKDFKGVNIAMWYVISDGSDRSPDVQWAYDTTGGSRNNINWAKGKLNVTNDKHLLKIDTRQSESDVEIYHKIGQKTGLVTKYAAANQVAPKRLFPAEGYALLMPQQITPTGWKATAIVECNGKQAAMNGMNIAFVNTLEEAQRLDAYMKTSSFIDEAQKYVGGMGNMVLWAMQSIDMSGFENAE